MENMVRELPEGTVKSIICVLLLPALLYVYSSKMLFLIVAGVGLFLLTGNRAYWITVICVPIKRDMRLISYLVKGIISLAIWQRKNMTVIKQFLKNAREQPEKIAFHTEKRSWTYSQVYELANKSAHMFKKGGVKRNDAVGIMIPNGGGVELPTLWLGLSTLGAVGALMPPLSKGTVLLHAITNAKITILVYSHHLVEVIREIKDSPEMQNVKLYQYNIDDDSTPLLENSVSVVEELKKMPNTVMEEEVAAGNFGDKLLYIYTSGTTGLPKAAVITNFRFLMIARVMYIVVEMTPEDILYTPLPLHHTAGGVLGVGQSIVCGITVVLRGKFSASNFWKDCIKYNCTVAQYIGEICRFLLIAAEKSGEANPGGPHKVRLMIGNGLRNNIWENFQKTFQIKDMYELYGATEGNTQMLNCSSHVGAVGFYPRALSFIAPIGLVRCDDITGEPIRDENGMCIPSKPCEPGLLVGKLDQKKLLYNFSGYVSKTETNKKILTDVYSKGDRYFNSGDVLIMDHLGYYYFKDRTGDTFRWRGENVSTVEVENIVSSLVGFTDTTVYGVQIPNVEGRAGMAAIVDPDNKIDFIKLKKGLDEKLPPFAHPMFIRIISNMEVTVTFKIIKRNLQKEGFDFHQIKDKMYFFDSKTSSYIPMTLQIYEDIMSGKIRL